MIKKFKVLFLSAAITFSSIGLAGCVSNKTMESDKMKVTLVLDEGGVNDQSFNESAWGGALAAKKKYGVEVSYIESKQETEYLSNIDYKPFTIKFALTLIQIIYNVVFINCIIKTIKLILYNQ